MISIVRIIATYYRNNKLLPDTTIDCMEYTLTAFVNEISKVLMYAIAFGAFGLLLNFLLAYIVFVSVRLFAGGVHCKTYWGCAIISFLMLGSCVGIGFIGENLKNLLFVFSLMSVVFPAFLSPVTPSFRIIKTDKHKMLLRIIAVLISLVWIVVSQVIVKNDVLSLTVLFAVSLVNYQLIIPAIIKHIKCRR